MSKSAYEAGKFVYIVRVAAVAAVLLSLVAAIGYALMMGGIGYKTVITLASFQLAVLFTLLKTARGSQRRAPARAPSVTRSPAPVPALPVQEGSTYRDGLRGIRLPFDEALGLGIIDL